MTLATSTSQAEQVAMRPRRLAHANLFVSNLDRSLTFYNKVCGLELVRLEPEIRAGFLSAGSTHHDVAVMEITTTARVGRDGHVQVPTGRGTCPGLNHFGWEMETEGELVAAYRRARAAGLDINRTTDHQISHSVYVFDPEGNLNEFYADAVKDWRRIFNLKREELVSGHWDPDARPPTREPLYASDPHQSVVEDAIFHPARISHAVLVVRDFDTMRAFYMDFAGLSVVEEREGDFVLLRGTQRGADLALITVRPGLAPGMHHFGLELGEAFDMTTAAEMLARAGVNVETKIEEAGKSALFVSDPDGLRVELRHPHKASRDRTPANATVSPYLF